VIIGAIRAMSYRYSVAISFLSRDEGLARELKRCLESRAGLPVFIYSDRQRELTGQSPEEAFSPIFESFSRIVVVLYRPEWGESGGTLVEFRAIQRRRNRSDEHFLCVIVVEKGASPPPWAEDLIYYDLSSYPLDGAAAAVLRMLEAHEKEHNTVPPLVPLEEQYRGSRESLCEDLRRKLAADFTTGEGIYQGYFGGHVSAIDSERWQAKGGEVVNSSVLPKLPYYHTYWGYEAALQVAPDYVRQWSPLTLAAIGRHFGAGRWLKVVREYSFSDGPRTPPYFAESVRHTARAAELTHLLSPGHRRVSEIAWQLLREAEQLQRDDGGWLGFRDLQQPSSLWSTAYIHRFLSKLTQPSQVIPDEREAFLGQAKELILKSERFLAEQWHENRWMWNEKVSWDESAAAILAEIGPFFSNDALILEVYDALRCTLTPAGRLEMVPTHLHEAVYTLRLAFGLKSAGRQLADNDSRYQRAIEWLADSIDLNMLTTYDIAFVASVFGFGRSAGGGD